MVDVTLALVEAALARDGGAPARAGRRPAPGIPSTPMRNSRARWWTSAFAAARGSSTASPIYRQSRGRHSPPALAGRRRDAARCDEDLGHIGGRGPSAVRPTAGVVRRSRRGRAGAQPRALARASRVARGPSAMLATSPPSESRTTRASARSALCGGVATGAPTSSGSVQPVGAGVRARTAAGRGRFSVSR